MKSTFLAISLILAFGGSNLASAASIATFTDRTAFEAALASVTTETFNGFTEDTGFENPALDVGDFTLDAGSNGGNNIVDAAPLLNGGNLSIDGTPYLSFLLSDDQPGSDEVADITFNTGITAFGFDHSGIGNASNGKTRLGIILGPTVESFLSDLTGVASEAGFFGVITDIEFTSVFLATSTNDSFSLDNLTYGTAPTPVPLPAGLPLLLLGIGGLATVRGLRAKTRSCSSRDIAT